MLKPLGRVMFSILHKNINQYAHHVLIIIIFYYISYTLSNCFIP